MIYSEHEKPRHRHISQSNLLQFVAQVSFSSLDGSSEMSGSDTSEMSRTHIPEKVIKDVKLVDILENLRELRRKKDKITVQVVKKEALKKVKEQRGREKMIELIVKGITDPKSSTKKGKDNGLDRLLGQPLFIQDFGFGPQVVQPQMIQAMNMPGQVVQQTQGAALVAPGSYVGPNVFMCNPSQAPVQEPAVNVNNNNVNWPANAQAQVVQQQPAGQAVAAPAQQFFTTANVVQVQQPLMYGM